MNVLTQRHRAQQLLLRGATQSQVAKLWPALNWTRLDATYPGLAVGLAQLIEVNRRTSAGIAGQYLRQFRRAEGVPGVVPLVLAEPLNVEQFSTSLRVTSLVAVKKSAAEGLAADVAMGNALTQTKGALARLVLDAGRDTIAQTTLADDKARGYRRVLGGGGCEFCQILAGRGGVYSADTADFEAHDHCGCTAEPVYT